MKLIKSFGLMVLAGYIAMAGGDNGNAQITSGYRTGGFLGLKGSYVFSIQSSIDYIPGFGYFDDSYDGSGGSFGVQIGGQEGQWRATLSYEYFDNDDSQNYDLFLAQIDYFFIENPSDFKPYLGIDGGWLNYETDGTSDSDGFAYGAALGVVFTIGENVDLDLSGRYLFSTQDEVDHVGSVNFAINYYY
jgi:hypothetical protein